MIIESGLSDYLFDAFKAEASDLHITAGRPPMIRVNGKVQALDYPELSDVTECEGNEDAQRFLVEAS